MRRSLLVMAMAWAAAPGCARPHVDVPIVSSVDGFEKVEGYENTTQRIKRDPIAYLNECLAETQKLKSFTTHFQRQERLGLIPQLKEQENIRAEFRDDPFSVRFTWMDEDSEYQQCVFVKGRNDDKVLLVPRKGLLGQPPAVQKYPAQFAVVFQKARNPITDFGPRRMMERILDRIEKARKHGEVAIKLVGAAEIGPRKEPCFHLELRYPPKDQFPCKLQDLYISTKTRLPVATYLWLPAKEERTEASLDGMYAYNSLNDDVDHRDNVFVLDCVKKGKSGTGGVKTAKTSAVDAGAASPRAAAETGPGQ
ncbi:MAG TPA: DUF1571 domain-containing protein [Phycisphaerae bacterium]|nr:DUF1571 domain-containing protein [Phycisphaerae bacterium]